MTDPKLPALPETAGTRTEELMNRSQRSKWFVRVSDLLEALHQHCLDNPIDDECSECRRIVEKWIVEKIEPQGSVSIAGTRTPGWLERLVSVQRREHQRAIGAHPMFSVEHWQHNAGQDWPQQPDDDSYQAFENCQHPDCAAARQASVPPVTPPDTVGMAQAFMDALSEEPTGIAPERPTTTDD